MLCLKKNAYSAVDQILNENFFLNPASLNLIQKTQFLIGDVFISPKLEFNGTTSLGSGRVVSKTHDMLPYLLTAYRFKERIVAAITITPSAYGHINWSKNSIVREATTTTKLFYYRIGAQSSYQLTDKLAIGVGVNLHYNLRGELDFVVPNIGNQINKMSGINHSVDAGLYYKINSHNVLSFAIYTAVNTFGRGSSSLGAIAVNNFYLNIIEAPVAYMGLQHVLSEKWSAEGKIYWSGWSIEKNVSFINKTNGSSTFPANWRDIWSFQLAMRYAITERIAWLSSIIYETNPVPTITNQIGYPLSASGAISAGFDINLNKEFSTQLFYGYGKFIPNAKINNSNSIGSIAVNFQSVGLQIKYK
ncbi:MAG: outer membrane protein transport protein, partial [Tatlockia sp.]|nr:outer membrane protein transport protein [Tatlockia sp.]